MALVANRDGSETSGGMTAIRDAFVMSASGKLVCLDASMSYDHSAGPNAQVLAFKGRYAEDGREFAVTSDPIPPGASLTAAARAMARKLLEPA